MRNESEIATRAHSFLSPEGSYLVPKWDRTVKLSCEKILTDYRDGRITEAIVLVPARVDTRWWRLLWGASKRRCLITGRLKFGDSKGGSTFPSALVYLGNNEEQFSEYFQDIGMIIQDWNLEAVSV